jgi:hypothetical protein
MESSDNEYDISFISSTQSRLAGSVDYNTSESNSIKFNKNDVNDSVTINTDIEPAVAIENQRSSQVWEHFTKDIDFKTNKKATCKYCKRNYTCIGGSTTNLHTHLKKHHPIKLNPSLQGNSIAEFFKKSEVNIKLVNSLFYLFIYL